MHSKSAGNFHGNDSRDIPLTANLLLIFGVTLMVVMGVASITPAFPKITRELGISVREVGLLISFFTVPGVLFAPVAGVLADRLGRKKILIPALFLFGIAGGACGFVTSFKLLLLLRFCQGLGATTMGTLNITILGDLYSGKSRTAVLGYNMSVLSVGTAFYPAIGGALAMLGWRYPFMLPFVAIPLGIFVIAFLDNPESANDRKLSEYIFEVVGNLKRKQAVGLFTISVISFLVFYGAYIAYLPLLLDGSFFASSLTIGFVMSITSITTAVTSSKVSALAEKTSKKAILIVGFMLFALSMLVFPIITSLGGFVIPTIILGLGMGMTIPCIQSLLIEMAHIKYRAAFLSFNSLVLRLGQTLGPILMGAVLVTGSIKGVFYTGAGFSLIMVFIAWILIE